MGALKSLTRRLFQILHSPILGSMQNEKLFKILKTTKLDDLHFVLESEIIPEELQLEVKKRSTVIRAEPLAHFLSFLCYFHSCDLDQC